MKEQKCPKCNIELENIETYRISIDDNFNCIATIYKAGECPECNKKYLWDICYDLENPLISDLEEL